MWAVPVPALEIGGTHVTAGLVDDHTATLVGSRQRLPLDGHASAVAILDAVVAAGAELDVAPASRWGVAMPGPFDYRRGIALFRDVGKFEALFGVDVRVTLMAGLGGRCAEMVFVNDADAFTLGEHLAGAAVGFRRCAGLTLGSGIGTGWVVGGAICGDGPGVPPEGRINNVAIGDTTVEDTVSRRAIRRAYATATGDADADVDVIAARCRDGERAARDVLAAAFRSLGAVLGPCLRDFGAEVLVVGGSMAASWDLFDPWYRDGTGTRSPEIRISADGERAALIGAARCALRA
jgi:glucokinase